MKQVRSKQRLHFCSSIVLSKSLFYISFSQVSGSYFLTHSGRSLRNQSRQCRRRCFKACRYVSLTTVSAAVLPSLLIQSRWFAIPQNSANLIMSDLQRIVMTQQDIDYYRRTCTRVGKGTAHGWIKEFRKRDQPEIVKSIDITNDPKYLWREWVAHHEQASEIVGRGVAKIEIHELARIHDTNVGHRDDIVITLVDGSAMRLHPSASSNGRLVKGLQCDWGIPSQGGEASALSRSFAIPPPTEGRPVFHVIAQQDQISKKSANRMLQQIIQDSYQRSMLCNIADFTAHPTFAWHLYVRFQPWAQDLQVTRLGLWSHTVSANLADHWLIGQVEEGWTFTVSLPDHIFRWNWNKAASESWLPTPSSSSSGAAASSSIN
jgi:hypothetical protein